MTPESREHLRVKTVDHIAIVSFVDTLLVEEEVIQAVGAELYRLVDDGGYTKLLLNFSHVRHLASAALGKIIGLKKKVQQAQGDVKLCRLHPGLMEAFRISHLDRVFDIYEDERDALDEF